MNNFVHLYQMPSLEKIAAIEAAEKPARRNELKLQGNER